MKVVALCKTLTGHEFVEAAIEAIYDYVDAIVFIHSHIGWDGIPFDNTVLPVVAAWASQNDKDNKIESYTGHWKSQEEQYKFGYRMIQAIHNPDWVMMIDTDEIWDYANLELAFKRILPNELVANSIAANMYTYIKSPFYRVEPSEMCKPAVFVRAVFPDMFSIRGNCMLPRLVHPDLWFHHFTYVRESENEIFRKIQRTLYGDKEDVPQSYLVDMEKWKREKWEQLPNCTDFHTTAEFETSWHSIQEVDIEDLPMTVQNKPIVQKFLTQHHIGGDQCRM